MQNHIDEVRELPLSAVLERGNLHLLSAREMNHLIAEGRLKAEQLLEYAIDRIQKDDSGAFVEMDRSALWMARQIDHDISEGRSLSELGGVITTSKDTYANSEVKKQFAGTRNPGSHPKKSWKAKEDAVMVDWLRKQETLLVGTTESSNLALDTQVHNVRHPYGEHLAARGSSAGAAVAARLLGGLHLTSDAAGSGRAPMVYNTGTYGLMLPYNSNFTKGHKPPLFDDPEEIINFGRAGLASQYVEDLALVSRKLSLISPELNQTLNKRLLLMDNFGLSLNRDNADALEKGQQILADSGFEIKKMDSFGGFELNELIRVAGRTLGSRVALSIQSGPWKNSLGKAFWRRTMASVILGQMEKYYLKQEKEFAQKNPGLFLEGFLEGMRDSGRYLKETDNVRKGIADVFNQIKERGYDGIIMPLDHAGQFEKCPTLQPINKQPYFDATAGLAAIANLAPQTSALAIPLGHFSNLPNGIQIVSSGPLAISNVLAIGQIIQERTGK